MRANPTMASSSAAWTWRQYHPVNNNDQYHSSTTAPSAIQAYNDTNRLSFIVGGFASGYYETVSVLRHLTNNIYLEAEL